MNNEELLSARPPSLMLSDEQRLSWLRLYRSSNVGPATFRDLINHCGSAQAAIEMIPDIARRGGGRNAIRIASREDAERELDAINSFGGKLIALGEPNYPNLLRVTEMTPPLITVLGNPEAMNRPAVSIVGSRNASMVGLKLTRQLGDELSRAGKTVVSGFARGIDSAAHQASLDRGTAAVFAGGIDHIYPKENRHLLERLIESGVSCAMTEMPFGWEPRARDFPRRNRLIAALAMGLIVVEAAQRSGSLITARLANELGRTVFAIPGSPLDPRSQGTNNLIREGATLATCAADVIEGLRSDPLVNPLNNTPSQASLFEDDDFIALPPTEDARSNVTSLLSPAPTEIDDIIAQSGIRPPQVALILLELDLSGRLERHSGNRVSIIEPLA